MKKGPICGTTCMKKSRTYMFQGLTVTLVSHLPPLPCVDTHIPYVVVVTHVRYGPKKKSATYMFQGFPLLVVTHIPYLVVVTLCCSVLQCVAVCCSVLFCNSCHTYSVCGSSQTNMGCCGMGLGCWSLGACFKAYFYTIQFKSFSAAPESIYVS